jgi:hypothetical protein
MKIKYLILLWLIIFPSLVKADSTEDVPSSLEVWMNDGSLISIPVNQKPVVSFTEKTVCINRLDNGSIKSIEVAREYVHKYTLGNNTSTDIGKTMTENSLGTVMKNRDVINIDGQKAYSYVGIYMPDGKNVKSFVTDEKGHLNINISTLNKGMYIIKTNSATVKITK